MLATPRVICVIGLLAAAVLAVGCSETTHVVFQEPEGAVLTYQNTEYTLPAKVPLERPSSKSGSSRETITLKVPQEQGPTLLVNGVVVTYGFEETDVDMLALNQCAITPEQIERIKEGYAITLTGSAASNKDTIIYKLILGQGE